jgi:hypothetical protein
MKPTTPRLGRERQNTLIALAVILFFSALAATTLEPTPSRLDIQDIRHRGLGVGTSLSDVIDELGHATEDESYRFGRDLLIKRWGKHGPRLGFGGRDCVYLEYLSEIELMQRGQSEAFACCRPSDRLP